MNKYIPFIFLVVSFSLNANVLKAQKPDTVVKPQITEYEIAFQKAYERNIKKERINGVYIPMSIDDAFNELIELSTPEALEKFKSGDEEIVAEKLQLGLGRWMMINWNLYEGSRIGHVMKEIGVANPEDQSKFMIILFHRYLNEKDLNTKELAKQIQDKRTQEIMNRKKQ